MSVFFMDFDMAPSVIWARDLYDQMQIRSDFRKWFPRMCQYGFVEGRDYEFVPRVRPQDEGGRTVQRYVKDYRITLEMAKQLYKLHHFHNIYLGEQEVIIDYIKKCKAMEGNVFNFEKFNQAIMEPIILYYLVVNLIRSGIPIYKILYEPEVYRNGKKLEYSVLAGSTDGKINRINVEIKTLECDPLSKKNGIHYVKDGTKVVKALTSDEEKVTQIKEQYPDYICLEYKDYYRQFNKNVKKIIEKYTGETTQEYNNINLGFIVLNRASSIEEFYSFLYNKRSGLIKRILPENLDALILFSLDAVNTVILDNLLEKNYIQTIVFNASNRVMAYLRSLGLDNIIQKEYDVRQSVYDLGQKEYMSQMSRGICQVCSN